MKKMVMIVLCVTGIGFIQSCTKSVSGTTQHVTVDATVVAGQPYSLNLTSYGTKAAITKQATNYSNSAVTTTGNTVSYNYVPASAKGTYTDQVVVAVTSESRCSKADSTIVTVNLSVQ